MRVLFTNIQLDHRTGTEIVTRDLAIGMRRHGHDVAVYTPHPGPLAEDLISNGVPVVDRIERVPIAPDVIHGHHHSPTVEALTRFPGTPAIWVCHDRLQYHDIPPRHPGINRYVAVDLNCRERLVVEAGIPESQVRIIHNAVDTERYLRRSKLPNDISRAAVFSNYAKPGGDMDAIAEGCRQLSVPLDVIGEAARTGSQAPEGVLGGYDLVFAKARCALEALATGCAVVLVDSAGMGPMVKTENMALLRDWNFGARCLQGAPTAERIIAELGEFDPADAALVTDWIRSVANLDGCLDQYLRLYEEVIAEGPAERPRSTLSPLDSALEYAATLERRLRLLQAPIVSIALPPTISADVRLRVLGQPTRVPPGATFGVDVVVSNQSNETLASLPPCPVRLSYHWICPDNRSRDIVEGVRTELSRPLYPDASLTERMTVEAPDTPGSYVLRVTLVQEFVFWFDELTPPVASWLTVEVAEDTAAATQTSRTITLSGLAATLPGSLGEVTVARDGTFADLGFVGDRSERMLVFAGSASFVNRAVANPAVSCIVTTTELADLVPSNFGVLTTTNPKDAFFRLHNWIASSTNFFADDRPTTVAASASVHPSAWIDPRAVFIGENCVIGANVVIHGPAIIGSDTKVDPGAVIGSAAFQTSERTGSYVELEHVGGVDIGTNCHIYSNASIARGVFRVPTKVGNRCQIGNGAFVSHQSQLGDNVFVGHNATVNGRVVVGDDVWIGPGAVISNELTIGTRAHIALGSTVMRAVPENGRVAGTPALEQHIMFRHAATLRSKRR